ncbi:MAG: tRNA dihydrouridine synthase DusB [Acutalibacteraceae bacterium]|nr:tRNA dihydrouridine synthase DusB [Acutalibacteraceae bacterium]
MKIGNLEIKGNACLAPMAGVADRAMRELCRGYGAAFTVGELTSVKALSLGCNKTKEFLEVYENERPMGVQLFGYEPDCFKKATEKAVKYHPDFIDINMGCPAPKVANNGGGSALMKNPKLAAEIVKAVDEVAKNYEIPVTAKIRAGFDNEHINAVEVAKRCEEAGAKAVTVHGRTRPQMYAPPVNLDIIKDVKEAVSIPVIGNGDIRDANDAAKMYEYTNCDLVMVGRAACGAPWIFQQIDGYLNETRYIPDPPVSERMVTLLKQVKMMIEYKDEYTAMRQARKHAAYYMRGIKGASAYRRDCGMLKTFSDLEKLCYKVFSEHKDDDLITD